MLGLLFSALRELIRLTKGTVMTKKLKCFISTPASTDISVLRRLLDQLDVEAYDPFDFRVGERSQDLLAKKIKHADFAIIVIFEKNSNVFYEMGICEGLGKPLFVIVGKDIEPPYFVQRHVYLRTDLDLENEDLLKISLTRFIESLRFNKAKPTRKPKKTKSASLSLKSAHEYTNRIENLRSGGPPVAVEQLAQALLSTLDLQFEPNQFESRDNGVDFAVWDDSLAFAIGNPLFVQVKYGSLTPDQVHQAENQLREYVAKTEAKAAILLYLDKRGRRFNEKYSVAPLVLRFDLEDFVRELSRATFKEVILNQQNKIVHGMF